MNDKERTNFFGNALGKSEEEKQELIKTHLENIVNNLIMVLYTPSGDKFKPDWNKIESLGIDSNEAINWQDLKVCRVKQQKSRYLIVIEEARPESSSFISYIEYYLWLWGWAVKVETEW